MNFTELFNARWMYKKLKILILDSQVYFFYLLDIYYNIYYDVFKIR